MLSPPLRHTQLWLVPSPRKSYQHQHAHTHTHTETEKAKYPAVLKSSLLWKGIFYIPDLSHKTCCLPFSAVGAVHPANQCVCRCVCELLIGPSNLTCKASCDDVKTLLSCVCVCVGRFRHTLTSSPLIQVLLLNLVMSLLAGPVAPVINRKWV